MLDAGPLVDFNRVAATRRPTSCPIAASASRAGLPHVLQANEFNANQWVDETEVPYTHDPEAAVQLGARADDRRQIAVLGAHVVPA